MITIAVKTDVNFVCRCHSDNVKTESFNCGEAVEIVCLDCGLVFVVYAEPKIVEGNFSDVFLGVKK